MLTFIYFFCQLCGILFVTLKLCLAHLRSLFYNLGRKPRHRTWCGTFWFFFVCTCLVSPSFAHGGSFLTLHRSLWCRFRLFFATCIYTFMFYESHSIIYHTFHHSNPSAHYESIMHSSAPLPFPRWGCSFLPLLHRIRGGGGERWGERAWNENFSFCRGVSRPFIGECWERVSERIG